MGLILDRTELAEALGVSQSAIGDWEKAGCPVKRKGRGQGIRSLYDFDQVRSWCAQTGRGAGRALIAAHGPMASAPAAAAPASPTRSRAAVFDETSRLFAQIFDGAMIAWAGMASGRYRISPEIAFEIIQDGLLALNVSLSQQLGYGRDDDPPMWVPWERGAKAKAAVLERIRLAAADFASDGAPKASSVQ